MSSDPGRPLLPGADAPLPSSRSEEPAVDTHLSAALHALRADDAGPPDSVHHAILTHAHAHALAQAQRGRTPADTLAKGAGHAPRAAWGSGLKMLWAAPAWAAAVVVGSVALWIVGERPATVSAVDTASQAPASPATRPAQPAAVVVAESRPIEAPSPRARPDRATGTAGETSPGSGRHETVVVLAEASRPAMSGSEAGAGSGGTPALPPPAATPMAPIATPMSSDTAPSPTQRLTTPAAKAATPAQTRANAFVPMPAPLPEPLQRTMQTAPSEGLRAALQTLDTLTRGQWRTVTALTAAQPAQASARGEVPMDTVQLPDGPGILLVVVLPDRVRVCASLEPVCWEAPLAPPGSPSGKDDRDWLRQLQRHAQ